LRWNGTIVRASSTAAAAVFTGYVFVACDLRRFRDLWTMVANVLLSICHNQSTTSGPLMSVQILVVDTDAHRAAQVSAPLQQAGYVVTRSGGFEDGMTCIRAAPPDVIVTNVRLGAYNGLHLILRARGVQPQIGAILIAALHDPVLASDAASFGAEYAVAPWNDPRPFVELVTRLVSAEPV
jgi:PleD family two-component response regulator